MKKILLPLSALVFFFFTACNTPDEEYLENTLPKTEQLQQEDYAAAGNGNAYGKLRNCPSQKLLKQSLKKSPGRARKLEQIEAHTRKFATKQKAKNKVWKGKKPKQPQDLRPSFTIPVYVHVIYSQEQENISTAQIQSQIDALNADYAALNAEMKANMLPNEFAMAAASTGIHFSWKSTDVDRKYSSRGAWTTADEMKSAATGGLNAVYPESYLNIWVCNLGNGALGYAQYPGGDPATDGVVISTQYFGTTGYVQAPFNKGRTTTHEVGHWLNLYHIWGDGNCSVDDLVADTPPSDRPNYGCPTFPTLHCGTNDMFMNFMDYTDDACMFMFTKGQRDRMLALLTQGGARESYVSSR